MNAHHDSECEGWDAPTKLVLWGLAALACAVVGFASIVLMVVCLAFCE